MTTDQVDSKTIFTEEDKNNKEDSTSNMPTSNNEVKISHPDYNQIFSDHLKKITDDRGEQKYRDVPTALEAARLAQEHIRTLEKENREFREKLVQQETLEKAFNELSAHKEPVKTKSDEINADQIEKLALSALEKREKELLAKSNMETVSSVLINQYGGDAEKAKQAFVNKAQELGISFQDLRDLSAKSPKATLAYFQVKVDSKPSVNKGTVNTETTFTKKDDTDYSSRYMSPSNPSVSLWKAAGESLNIGN